MGSLLFGAWLEIHMYSMLFKLCKRTVVLNNVTHYFI